MRLTKTHVRTSTSPLSARHALACTPCAGKKGAPVVQVVKLEDAASAPKLAAGAGDLSRAGSQAPAGAGGAPESREPGKPSSSGAAAQPMPRAPSQKVEYATKVGEHGRWLLAFDALTAAPERGHVPCPQARESVRAPPQAEAREAFRQLLASVNPAQDWTWEDCMKRIVHDARCALEEGSQLAGLQQRVPARARLSSLWTRGRAPALAACVRACVCVQVRRAVLPG